MWDAGNARNVTGQADE